MNQIYTCKGVYFTLGIIMLKVYCDTGAYRSELADLELSGTISLFQFKYENKNRKIKQRAEPSRPTWSELKYTWRELSGLTWNDMGRQSNIWPEIIKIVGSQNATDAKHLDSAYMTKCAAFITSDKTDIANRKDEIENLLNIRIFHYIENWDDFLAFVTANK
jgi:hypothetical protein